MIVYKSYDEAISSLANEGLEPNLKSSASNPGHTIIPVVNPLKEKEGILIAYNNDAGRCEYFPD